MEIFSIGFTGRTAEDFFETLRRAGVRRLVDVRLNNTSQLSAFAKKQDLAYFLHEVLGADYVHEPVLAPTPELLKAYRNKLLSWDAYEHRFRELLRERNVESVIDASVFSPTAALLCSEHSPERCHRRLVIEHLAEHWQDVTPVHL